MSDGKCERAGTPEGREARALNGRQRVGVPGVEDVHRKALAARALSGPKRRPAAGSGARQQFRAILGAARGMRGRTVLAAHPRLTRFDNRP